LATSFGQHAPRETDRGRHASNAVDHDDDGVGDMVFRNRAATVASSDHPHCPTAECVQRYGGGATGRRPQAKPHSDTCADISSAGGRVCRARRRVFYAASRPIARPISFGGLFAVVDAKLMATSADGRHRPGCGIPTLLAILNGPQDDSSLDACLSPERWRLVRPLPH